MKKHYIYLLIGLTTALVVAVYFFMKIEVYLYENEMEKIEVNYQTLERRVEAFVQEKDTFIQMIAENGLVRTTLSTNRNASVKHTQQFFYNLVKGNETIMQLRLIDLDGKERVRIDRKVNNQIVQIEGENLQDKSQRDYFKTFSQLKEKQMAFSSLDLNIEGETIEVPWRPTLRMGMPVFIDGRRIGTVVINYEMKQWLHNLSTITFNNFYLVDKEGYFILHPNDNWQWSRYQTPPKKLNQFFHKQKNINLDFSNVQLSDNFFVKKIDFFNHQTMYALYEPKVPIDRLLYQKGLQVIGFIALVFMLILLPVVRLIWFFINNLNVEILERKEAEEELKLYQLAVDQSTSSIYITNKDGLIEYANPYFCQTTGYQLNEILGRNPKIFRSGKHTKEFYKELWSTILLGNSWHGELVNKNKNGEIAYAITSISPIKNKEGQISHFVAVREDITKLKALEARLIHKANFDILTNLPNRRLFFERLKNTLLLSKENSHAFALLFLDLDGFKCVNDNYGHESGDMLLIEVSKRLKQCVRETDTVARVGGDEFVILLTKIELNDKAGIVAQRILDTLAKPFECLTHNCTLGASIGISLYPKNSVNLDELLALADNAMYKVKSSGKNNYAYS